jgi:hypothetical protein
MFVADSDVTKTLAVETMRKAGHNFCFDPNSNISQAAEDDDLLYEETIFCFIKN